MAETGRVVEDLVECTAKCALYPLDVTQQIAHQNQTASRWRDHPTNNDMIWQPLNLTEACPPHTPVSACTDFGLVYLSLLVRLYGGSADERQQQLCEREGTRSRRREEYDFIVVGAGAAGCVVANRLTENPNWKVLLLEAGPEEPDVTLVPGLSTALLGSNIDWRYSTQPNGRSCLAHPGGRCPWPRGKMMGGSSSINSMAYIRGNRADYDAWASLGNEGWSYEDVLPFFKKSERNMNLEALDSKYHGAKGEQFVSRFPYIDKPSLMLTEAFHEGGLPLLDYNGAQQVGTMQAQAVSLDGERVSTNVAFIQPIRNKRHNLDIETNAEATKILIDDHKNAYGIEYVKHGKLYTAYARKEVIVSAGAINSPKLLMLSGIGPKDHLESLGITVIKNLPVGENLHDHVTFSGLTVALSNKTATAVDEQEILRAVEDYADMDIKRGPLSGNGPVNSILFLKTDPELIAPDIQVQVNSVPNWREFIQDPVTGETVSIMPTAFYDAVMPRVMNLVPRSRGVLLLNTTDPHADPLLYANYFGDERDFVPILKGLKFILSLENSEAFKSNGAYFVRERLPHCKQHAWGTDEYFLCLMRAYTSTTYHPVGTCRMGAAWDAGAVLDPALRVRGVGALRVADASVMPVVVRGNTNAPSIMIGERGADFIVRYWRERMQNYC